MQYETSSLMNMFYVVFSRSRGFCIVQEVLYLGEISQ